MNRKLFSLVGLILSVLLLGGCGTKQSQEAVRDGKITIIAAHATTSDYVYHIGMETFAKSVTAKTNGKVEVKIYPNGQLGTNEREVVEALQLGTVNMTVVNGAVISNFAPRADVFNLPFIFRDVQHLYKASDGEPGNVIAKDLEAKGLKVLAWWSNPQRSMFNSKRPINTLADLKGLKIRVTQSPVSIETFNALGALPTPMAYGEVYSGLQQGVIDGAENDPISVVTMKFNEVAKYYSVTNHFMVACPLLMDMKYFNNLPPDVQTAVQEAAVEGREAMRRYMEQETDKAMQKLASQGAVINKVQDIEPFRKAVEPVYTKFEATLGKDLIEMVRNVK
ncbi:MAG: TRAP transporter substrate-binding protein [Negativicutes bacterium]|nr:TRAP transporter substrate-binding protein [Negativicutes bacterium]